MEDQAVHSPQTFLVNKFFFLQQSQKREDQSALQVSFDDRSRFEAAFWTKRQKW